MLGASVLCVCASVSPPVLSLLEFSCCSTTSLYRWHSLQHIYMHATTYPIPSFFLSLCHMLPSLYVTSLHFFFFFFFWFLKVWFCHLFIHDTSFSRSLKGPHFHWIDLPESKKKVVSIFHVTIFILRKRFISYPNDANQGPEEQIHLPWIFNATPSLPSRFVDINRTQG
jgi:hypothetical protein